jgi:hypothetical protein
VIMLGWPKAIFLSNDGGFDSEGRRKPKGKLLKNDSGASEAKCFRAGVLRLRPSRFERRATLGLQRFGVV